MDYKRKYYKYKTKYRSLINTLNGGGTYNKITDVNFSFIDLSQNDYISADLYDFFNKLKGITRVQQLDLSSNKLSDLVNMRDAIRYNRSIKILDLSQIDTRNPTFKVGFLFFCKVSNRKTCVEPIKFMVKRKKF